MAKYEYQRLESELHIRLLRITGQEGTRKYNQTLDQVQLDLVSFPLKKCPSYTAMSYTWGSPDRKHTVQVSNKIMPITATLHAALPNVLSLKHLWIDQICINQDDIEERNVQVALMRDIYRKSEGLLVWLDNDEKVFSDLPYSLRDFDNPNFVFGSIFPPSLLADPTGLQARRKAMIARCVAEVDFFPTPMTALGAERTIRQEKKSALIRLLNLPWFSRAWVFQEFVISTQASVRFQAGSRQIQVQEMFNIVFGAQEAERVALEGTGHHGELFLQPGSNPFLQMVRKMDEREGMRTLSTLPGFLSSITFNAKATNPRDYVYAFLEFWGKDADLVTPDYTLPTETVFTLSASKMSQASNSLDILGFCSSINGEAHLLPSWVPNWGSPDDSLSISGHYHTEDFTASGTYQYKVKPANDLSRLVVRGKQIDCIDGMFYNFPANEEFAKLPPSLYQFLKLDSLCLCVEELFEGSIEMERSNGQRSPFADLDSGLDRTKSGIRERVFGVILAGAKRPITTRTDDGKDDIHPPPESIQQFLAAHDAFEIHSALEQAELSIKRLMSNSDQNGVPEEIKALLAPWAALDPSNLELIYKQHYTFGQIYWQALMACGRSIAKGTGNILGLVNQVTEPGDLVCVLHGSKTPIILREKPNGTYIVIGQCYWEGVMHGESVTWSEDMADEFVLV